MSGVHSQTKNQFVSFNGGQRRVFKYSNPTEKTAAYQARIESDNALDQATIARAKATLNRPPTNRELVQGLPAPPDVRPARERIKADSKGYAPRERSPDRDIHQDRIAELQAEKDITAPRNHGPIDERIRRATVESAKFQTTLAARKLEQDRLAEPAVQTCLSLANSGIVMWSTSHEGYAEDFLKRTIELQDGLKDGSVDPESFRNQYGAILAERATILAGREAEALQVVEQSQADAADLKKQRLDLEYVPPTDTTEQPDE